MICLHCGKQLKCDNCKEKIPSPTRKEQEAYRLVHMHGLTQEAAGAMLGVNKSSVHRRLKRLKAKRPDLFDVQIKRVRMSKILSYEDTMAYDAIKTF